MNDKPNQKQGPGAFPPCAVDIFVASGFIQLEVSCITEALRVANRISGQEVFSYTYRHAKQGGPVESASQTTLQTTSPEALPDADYAVFVGHSDPEFQDFFTRPLLDSYRGRGKEVILLAEAATAYIQTTDDQDLKLATHWEGADRLLQSAPLLQISPALATKSGNLVTCAGMVASLDWALSVVEVRTSKLIADHVRHVHLYGNQRDLRSEQGVSVSVTRRFRNALTNKAVAVMEQNLEQPLTISQIAKEVGASTRALERQFKASTGKTPIELYRELRLLRAKDLLLNTTQSIQDIADACGFGTSFSKQFRDHFGMPPTKMRQQL